MGSERVRHDWATVTFPFKAAMWNLWQTPEGEGNGTPLQYSSLENPMDGGAWWAAVHGVAKSQTRLSYLTLTFHFHALEKEIATHSSVLACIIPGTGEPGGLLSLESHRVRHDWSDLAAAAWESQYRSHILEQWNGNFQYRELNTFWRQIRWH